MKKILMTSWVFLSVVVHAGVGGGTYLWFVVRKPAPIVADLDLTMAPLMPVAPNKGGGIAPKKSETWTLPKKNKPAPVPQPAVQTETKEEVNRQESQTAPCVEPCPEGGTGTGGGGTGEGEGQYIPEEAATRKPRWIKNFIRPSDYPQVARQHGRDGRVYLVVLIGADGLVKDARLLRGSYDVLNEVALRKVKEAVFSPAYDHTNKPVSCKVLLPIRFELR